MGKKYVPVATKRLRAAANRRNLAFLIKEEEETDQPAEQPNQTAAIKTDNPGVAMKMPFRRMEKPTTDPKNSVTTTRSRIVRSATNRKKTQPKPSDLLVPKNRILLSSSPTHKITSSPGVQTVSPIKDRQMMEIQMDFFRDWEDDDDDMPELQRCTAAARLESEANGQRKMPDSPTVLRTYSTKCIQRKTSEESADYFEDENGSEAQTAVTIECSCGQQPAITKLLKDNATMKAQNEKLKKALRESNKRCLKLTDFLNSKIIGEPQGEIFTEIEGFPSTDQLKNFSNQAIKSDYTFVRLLMEELWPDGFLNRSVSGRSSNNPHGRPKAGVNKSQIQVSTQTVKRIPLEPDKVKYLRDRLLEHRIFRGDSPAVAKSMADEAPRLMKRVLAYYGKRSLLTNSLVC
ncbi:uncharacterized protein LOC134222499 [Armigeres subalbatus]|uniref:uncharacterized protein LOC134222499 n=1 Tax=Armigeres subalbatus TaxID=124917 RepID=UPI002ED2BE4B